MIRPPSSQRTYDTFFSGDTAVKQCVRVEGMTDEAWETAQTDHAHALAVARETGDWAPLKSGDGEITRFTLRQVPGDAFRALMDRAMLPSTSPLRVGLGSLSALLVRLALVGVVNAGDLKVEFIEHPWLGRMASADVTNAFDACDTRIVNELAEFIQERQVLHPKS